MKRFVSFWVCFSLVLAGIAVPCAGGAEQNGPDVETTPFHACNSTIEASLSASGATATCSGEVASSSPHHISIPMALMRKSGSV